MTPDPSAPAFHAAPRYHGRGKERFICVFGKIAKEFESWIVVSLARNRQQTLLASHPARQSFPELQFDAPDGSRMGIVRSAQYQFFFLQAGGPQSSGIVAAVAGIYDDASDLEPEGADERAIAGGGRLGFAGGGSLGAFAAV